MASPPRSTVRFGSRRLPISPGRSLLEALWNGRLPILQRSIRYHRPRAPFCGVGQCTQCLVRVNGVPNVRACRYVPGDGDVVETENAWPSPNHDVLGALDLLLPGGIDTLRGFRRPAFLTPLYHQVVRRLSGYGRIADRPGGIEPPAARRIETEVAVLGTGIAGAAALSTLAEHGIASVGIDTSPIAAVRPGVAMLSGTTVAFLPPPRPEVDRPWRLIAVEGRRRGVDVRARSVIIATGGYDAGLWFAGSDRPGVVTAEGALAFTEPNRAPFFRRAVVFGGGERAAEILDRCGPQVDAVVAPGSVSPELTEKASALEVPLYPRTLLMAAIGRRRVRGVRLRSRADGAEFSLETDAVILAHRRLPHPQLYFQAGAEMEWRNAGGAYYPKLGRGTATSQPGLFGAGEGAGFVGTAAAEASGTAAAMQALGEEPPSLANLGRVDAIEPNEIEGYYRQLFAGRRPKGKWIVCPCEDVMLTEIEEAHERGYRGIEVIKRYTGVGSGLCQGRYCLPDTLLLLARLEQRRPTEVGYITQRPPVTPLPLSAFAGLPDESEPTGAAR